MQILVGMRALHKAVQGCRGTLSILLKNKAQGMVVGLPIISEFIKLAK
jgi:hypothetical protein